VKLTAGVRQGGVLSPLLFVVFVDDLLIELRDSTLGCHIKGICLNAAMYADDLLLMSISVCQLQRMVDLCLDEFNKIDMLINVKKSICIRIGDRHKADVGNIVINAERMDWKCELKYLGVYFVASKVLKCNLQMARQKYFRALNGLFAKVGTRSSPIVTLSLVESFCAPLLGYSIESFNVRQADFNYLDSAYNAAFSKIFTKYDKIVIGSCQFYCGLLPFSLKADIKRLKFYAKLACI
jgi:hypothetical protein